jgi:hypothetical protein
VVPPEPPRELLLEERATLLTLLNFADFDGRDAFAEVLDADGYPSGLEVFSYRPTEPTNPFPPLDRLRLFERPRGPRPA